MPMFKSDYSLSINSKPIKRKCISCLLLALFLTNGCTPPIKNDSKSDFVVIPAPEIEAIAVIQEQNGKEQGCINSAGFEAYLRQKGIRTSMVPDYYNPDINVGFNCFLVNERRCIELSLINKGVPIYSNLYLGNTDNLNSSAPDSTYQIFHHDIINAVTDRPEFIRGGDPQSAGKQDILNLARNEKYLDQYRSDEYAMDMFYGAVQHLEKSRLTLPEKINAYLQIIDDCDQWFGYHLRPEGMQKNYNSHLYHSGFRSELFKKYIYARLYHLYEETGQDGKKEMALINYFFCDAYLGLPSTLQESRIVIEYENENRTFTKEYKKAETLKPVSFVAGFALFVPVFLLHFALDRLTLGQSSKNRDVVSALKGLNKPADHLMNYYKNIDNELARMFKGLTGSLEKSLLFLDEIINKSAARREDDVRKIREKLYQLRASLNSSASALDVLNEFYAIHQKCQKLQKTIRKNLPAFNGRFSLSVDTDPKDAHVHLLNTKQEYVDGILLDPGIYQIEVSKPGYDSVVQPVSITDDDVMTSVRLNIAEVKKSAPPELKISTNYPLYITTKPEDATVRILNITQKFTQGMSLKPGKYKIEVSKKDYHTTTRTVTIKDKSTTVPIELQKKSILERIKGFFTR